jgi:ligand-binding SRPBCC domain-containing protein
MAQFEYSSFIDAPVEAVFGFHQRPDAIELLTPPERKIEVVHRSGGIETGAVVEFLIPLGPFRIRWLAHHIAYEKNRLFIDEQRKGPFTAWVHAHHFAAEGRGTRLTDSIEFAMPGRRAVEAVAGWWVKRELRKVFAYRHLVTRKYCEGGR